MRQLFNQFFKVGMLLLGALLLTGTAVAQQKNTTDNTLQAVPITGTVGNNGTFAGTLDIQKFTQQNNQLYAVGLLKGTVTDASGKSLGSVVQNVALPAAITQTTCQILNLTLGPLDLNLLGLQVHLNQVVLNITAQPSGGLLGQLLCSLAGATALDQIVSLLNQILGILQAL